MQTSTPGQSFYGRGKLLLTGEYLVLNGAKALAVPLKQGQFLSVSESADSGLIWETNSLAGHWFNVRFDEELGILETDDPPKAEKLQSILEEAIKLNPDAKKILRRKKVVTQLEFNRNWGWGSSSTLIHNLAQWLKVDGYQLLNHTIGGSGYDLACAAADTAIFYQLNAGKPRVTPVEFAPKFQDNIWFVYTGQKQRSDQEVKRYLSSATPDHEALSKINALSDLFLKVDHLHQMGRLMQEHEQIIGSIIDRKPVQEEVFPDFDGYIKSLGAWGGDFVMALTEWDEKKTINYFKTKGLKTVFSFKEIILNR